MKLAAGQVTMTWLDVAGDELNYLIERQLDSGAWTTEGTLPPLDGVSARWSRDVNSLVRGTYRVSAAFNGYTVPLHIVPDETEISFDPAALPQIQAQPPGSDGSVQVSLANAQSALSATYILEDVPVTTVTGADTFAATLPAQQLVTGLTHLYADVQQSAGLTIQVEHTLVAPHDNPAVLLHVAPAPALANSLEFRARTSSAAGIVSLALFANGNLVRELITPKYPDYWLHVLDTAVLPTGTNTFRVVATDANGATASMDVQYTLDRLALSVEGVFDGMITARDRLTAHGAFENNDGTSVLYVTLDGRPIIRTRTSPFDFDYALTDLPPGEYPLVLRVENAAGKTSTLTYRLTVPSTSRSYELIATDAMHLLAAKDGALLYRKNSGAVVLRDGAGVETAVETPPGVDFYLWWLTNGRIVAQERVNRHVHVLTAPGESLDLHAINPPSFGLPYAHGDWLSLIARSGPGFTAYYLPSGDPSFIDVSIPGHTETLSRHAFISQPTNESFVFSGVVDGIAGIYRHRLFAGTTQRLVTGNYRYLRIDDTRLAVSDGTTLMASTRANPTALTPLGTHEGDIYLEDGLLCWQGPDWTLYVNDGSTTTQLASASGFLWDDSIEDDYVVFYDSGKMYSWNRTSGKSLVLDGGAQELHTQGVAYLQTGDTGALYRTALP